MSLGKLLLIPSEYKELVIIYSFVTFIKPVIIHDFFFFIIGYNILLDLMFKYLNWNVFQKKQHTVLVVILSTFLRFTLSIVFVFIFGLISATNFMLFAVNFLVVFLLFIIFEITILLINLQR